MKSSWILAGSALLALTLWTATAWAETRYISDQLVVSLRDQPQQNAQSINHLKTDTPVTVLEETGEFVKVKTEAGEIGYVQKYYLKTETPKAVIISKLQQERDRLASKVEELKQQIATANARGSESQQALTTQLAESDKQLEELRQSLEESQAALARTSQEYQTLQNNTKDVIAITSERDKLRKSNQELAATVATLKSDVEDLTMTGIIKWFLAGAGVLLLGWIIGKFSGGRRRSMF